MRNRFNFGDSFAFHLDVDSCVAVGGCRAGVAKKVTDSRQIYARLQKGDGRAVADAMWMQPLLAQVRRFFARQAQTSGEDMADSETGYGLPAVIQKYSRLRPQVQIHL